MKRLLLVLICFSCSSPVAPSREQSQKPATYQDTLALIDTAYIAPGETHIRPPCSMSPDYCKCMRSRGARI
jgi:hypothetical protein